MNEVHACIAARHLRHLEVQDGEFPRSAERLSVRNDFGNDSPFVRGARRQRLWVQQKRFGPPCSSAITPRRKYSIPWHDASREVGDVVESRTLACDDHVGQQRIL